VLERNGRLNSPINSPLTTEFSPPEPPPPESLVVTQEQLLALPKRPCVWCGNYNQGWCLHYDRELPFPMRQCRCVHYAVRQ
jgi:hypothetical protein